MRIAFLGSSPFALPTLARLHDRLHIGAIVTQPARPAGRGGHVTPTPVGQWAREHAAGVELIEPEDVNAPEVVARMRGVNADAWVVIAFGQKLSQELLGGVFAINLHASLLPRWRGASPVHSAILAGDEETGNSVITIAERMDAGVVLAQSRREIEPDQTTGMLHDLLAADGPEIIGAVLEAFGAGRLSGATQDEARVTRARKLSRDDAWVDFGACARACRCRINALSPWPGVSGAVAGSDVKFLRACEADRGEDGEWRTLPNAAGLGVGTEPGTLVDSGRGLVVCGGGTVLRLLEVQAPGKRPMPWAEYARGRRIESPSPILGRKQGC
ncbi:MAG: methionyl-tRNA formyltransferase [Phycisphaeraceae bacterium]|nr:methionyl-tRNA formyltransferase [Phycisphaeraceae bacterium]